MAEDNGKVCIGQAQALVYALLSLQLRPVLTYSRFKLAWRGQKLLFTRP
jgi:hypothetical protein